MQLGASLPVGDIGTGPTVLRDYAQAAEGLGYNYLVAPDHVLGGDPAKDYGGGRGGTTATAFPEPVRLFAFPAGRPPPVAFFAPDLLLAQRPTPPVAREGACPGALCARRL